jgi:uncharacterized protein YuzE
MNIKYFSDTDTALLEISDHAVERTVELSENIYIDLDSQGNLVSLTIEHAQECTRLPNLSYQQMGSQALCA